jgi:septal ring factor EnvC (AmiA/AmiB activator)
MNLSLLLALATGFLSPLSAEETREVTKEEIVQQLDLLEEQISELEQIYNLASQERSAEEQKLANLENKVAVSVNQLRKAETAVRLNQKQIVDLMTTYENLMTSKQNEEKVVAQHVQAAQRIGQDGPVKLILNQQDPSSLSRMSKYYKFMSEARIEQIKQYQRTLLALEETKQELDATTASLESSRVQWQKQSDQLADARQERQDRLNDVLEKMQATNSSKQKLTLDRDNLESVLTRLENSILTLPTPDQLQPLSQRKGQLEMPSQGNISQYFGQARVKNKVYWKGLLIDAPTGTPVRSIHYGRVVFADWLRGFGLLIIINHGDGFMSLYGHNQVIYPQLGDWILTGETIAEVGNSGGLRRSGLYFEIRQAGLPVDPQLWCKRPDPKKTAA